MAAFLRVATAVNARLLPVLTIAVLSNPARQALVRDGDIRAGIYMDFDEVDPPTLVEAVEQAGVRPEQCVLFVDFTGAPLGVNRHSNLTPYRHPILPPLILNRPGAA